MAGSVCFSCIQTVFMSVSLCISMYSQLASEQDKLQELVLCI